MNRPNIVFVLTDDQGYGDLGFTGHPHVTTPNIDTFAGEAARMTDFHVGPTCAPTRAGLMTGHYANSTGVWHTIGGRSLLRDDEWTLPTALAESGYATGIFGKWHLGDTYPYRPHDRGFQSAVVHGGGGITQTPDFWGNDYFDDTYFVNGRPRRFEGYCTDVWFDLAMRFISDHKDSPFFCYVPTNAPHSPYNVEDRYADLYRGAESEARARFHGMITNIDENFGKLRAHLRALGIEDNTVLIFMTDNGTSAGARVDSDGHVLDGYNAGRRGVKGSPYDGGHRVPFFLRYPAGEIAHGYDVNRIAANVDFMPTMLELCGIAPPPERSFDGRSLVPLIRSGSSGDVPSEWPDRVIVTDSQRVAYPIKWRMSSTMTDRWRLIDGTELYDIRTDPAQRHDVSGEHSDVVAKLRAAYEAWWENVSRQFDRVIPHAIGGESWSESILTSHDLRNDACEVAWNQGHIRAAFRCRGYWELRVETAGRYRIELRRWPRELGYAVTAGIEGPDIEWRRDTIAASDHALYEGGTAVAATGARLTVAGAEYTTPLEAGSAAAEFMVELPAGETELTAEFLLGDDTLAAYYVYISR